MATVSERCPATLRDLLFQVDQDFIKELGTTCLMVFLTHSFTGRTPSYY